MSKLNPSEHLERIRQARDSEEPSTETVDIFTCPIDGCSRTVIGAPGHLRNHVQQTEDAYNRFKLLNEELEIEFDEEAYHAGWGPGHKETEERDENWSIYHPGDPWGPGALNVES